MKLGIKNWSLSATWRWKLHDPTSIYFHRVPACDEQTDRQPVKHSSTYTYVMSSAYA